MAETICPHCGVFDSEHNYEHMARDCYPKQIERLRAALRAMMDRYADDEDAWSCKLECWTMARAALEQNGDGK